MLFAQRGNERAVEAGPCALSGFGLRYHERHRKRLCFGSQAAVSRYAEKESSSHTRHTRHDDRRHDSGSCLTHELSLLHPPLESKATYGASDSSKMSSSRKHRNEPSLTDAGQASLTQILVRVRKAHLPTRWIHLPCTLPASHRGAIGTTASRSSSARTLSAHARETDERKSGALDPAGRR